MNTAMCGPLLQIFTPIAGERKRGDWASILMLEGLSDIALMRLFVNNNEPWSCHKSLV